MVAEAHAAHAAALHYRAGSARAFLSEDAPLTVWALNGAEVLTLLPAMHVSGKEPLPSRSVTGMQQCRGAAVEAGGRPLAC